MLDEINSQPLPQLKSKMRRLCGGESNSKNKKYRLRGAAAVKKTSGVGGASNGDDNGNGSKKSNSTHNSKAATEKFDDAPLCI